MDALKDLINFLAYPQWSFTLSLVGFVGHLLVAAAVVEGRRLADAGGGHAVLLSSACSIRTSA